MPTEPPENVRTSDATGGNWSKSAYFHPMTVKRELDV